MKIFSLYVQRVLTQHTEYIRSWKGRTSITEMKWNLGMYHLKYHNIDLRIGILIYVYCIIIFIFVFPLNFWNVYKYKHISQNSKKGAKSLKPKKCKYLSNCSSDYAWYFKEFCLKLLISYTEYNCLSRPALSAILFLLLCLLVFGCNICLGCLNNCNELMFEITLFHWTPAPGDIAFLL